MAITCSLANADNTGSGSAQTDTYTATPGDDVLWLACAAGDIQGPADAVPTSAYSDDDSGTWANQTTMETTTTPACPDFGGGNGSFAANIAMATSQRSTSNPSTVVTVDLRVAGTGDPGLIYTGGVAEIAGHDSTTPVVQTITGVSQSASGRNNASLTVTLSTTGGDFATGNLVVAFLTACADNGGSSTNFITAPTCGGQAMTQLYTDGTDYQTSAMYYRVLTGDETSGQITCTDFGSQSYGVAIVAREIAAASTGLSITPTGASISATPGTLTVDTDTPITPTGATVTATPGTVTVSTQTAITPTGASVTVTPGSLTVAPGAVDISPTGVSVSVTAGTLTVTTATPIAPTGPTVTATPGSLTVTTQTAITPTGASVSATAGTLTVSQGIPISPTGASVSVTPGTVSVDLGLALTGASVTVTPGTLTVTQGITIAPDGASVSVTAGTLTVAPGAVAVSPVGASITVTAGTLTVAEAQPISPTGASVSVTAGTVSVDLGLTLTGASVSVTAGTVTLDQAISLTGATITVTPSTLSLVPVLAFHITSLMVQATHQSLGVEAMHESISVEANHTSLEVE